MTISLPIPPNTYSQQWASNWGRILEQQSVRIDAIAERVYSTETTTFTASRAIVSNGSGSLAASAVTATELGYLTGATSSIQSQIESKQAFSDELTAIAAITTSGTLERKGAGTWATYEVTGFAQTLLDDADAAAMRTTLGLGTAATQNTGVSGSTIPLCNGDLTLSGINAHTGINDFLGGMFVSSAMVFNEGGANIDARFEGDTDANLIFLDASTDRIGIGTNSPELKLHVWGGNAGTDPTWNTAIDIAIFESDGGSNGAVQVFTASSRRGILAFSSPTTRNRGTISFNHADDTFQLYANGVTTTFGAAGLLSTVAIGYGTGAGGAVTQLTSKSTGVTLNNVCGQITMHNSALAAGGEVSFTLTNSTIAATDVVHVCIASGASANVYFLSVTAVAAGSCRIALTNVSAGSPGEALVLNFVVIKSVAA